MGMYDLTTIEGPEARQLSGLGSVALKSLVVASLLDWWYCRHPPPPSPAKSGPRADHWQEGGDYSRVGMKSAAPVAPAGWRRAHLGTPGGIC